MDFFISLNLYLVISGFSVKFVVVKIESIMKPSFTLIHTECINAYKDSVCHIILIPVVEGERQAPKEYIVNPESKIFEGVSSGLTRKQVEKSPTFASKWPEIMDILELSPMIVSSADGNSIYSLQGTVERLGLKCPEMAYLNSKAICRRSLNELIYNFNHLCGLYWGKIYTVNNPIGIAEGWTDLVIKGLRDCEDSNLIEFAKQKGIRIGMFSSMELIPSISISPSKLRGNRKSFDASKVEVNPNEDHPFFGLNVVFTGKMQFMSRDEAREYVISIGGNSPNSLSKKTDVLVVGQEDVRNGGCTGKLMKANEYKSQGSDIEVMYEQDFVEIYRAFLKKS